MSPGTSTDKTVVWASWSIKLLLSGFMTHYTKPQLVSLGRLEPRSISIGIENYFGVMEVYEQRYFCLPRYSITIRVSFGLVNGLTICSYWNTKSLANVRANMSSHRIYYDTCCCCFFFRTFSALITSDWWRIKESKESINVNH